MVARIVLLSVAGLCYGLLAAAGVFTVFVAVGLVPRFAGRTKTADHILLYEEMVIFGTMFGCVLSIFEKYCQFSAYLETVLPKMAVWLLGMAGQLLFGMFGGIFIGCLALAIAEMLDSIPIFTRRISFKIGLTAAVFGMAFGKLAGSLYYFINQLYRTAE